MNVSLGLLSKEHLFLSVFAWDALQSCFSLLECAWGLALRTQDIFQSLHGIRLMKNILSLEGSDRAGLLVSRSKGLWVYGFMGLWVYGFMGLWVPGFVGMQVCVFARFFAFVVLFELADAVGVTGTIFFRHFGVWGVAGVARLTPRTV